MSRASEAVAAVMPAPLDGISRRFDHIRALFVQTPASLVGCLIGWSPMVAM